MHASMRMVVEKCASGVMDDCVLCLLVLSTLKNLGHEH